MIKKKSNEETTTPNERNFLSIHSKIKGDISTQGVLRIDGIVEGNITVQGRLILGAKSKVQGNIISDSLEIEGTLIGDCKIKETLALKQSAVVQGNIAYKSISIDLGAQFTGTSKILSTEEKKNIKKL
ncbi:MAG: polymer-forming cytoskeletal protein [Flavobacteriales bacterium]